MQSFQPICHTGCGFLFYYNGSKHNIVKFTFKQNLAICFRGLLLMIRFYNSHLDILYLSTQHYNRGHHGEPPI